MPATRREFFQVAGAGLLALAGTSLSARKVRASPSQPNIILFFDDDHEFPYYHFMGSLVQTPNYDLLAQTGIAFTNGYVTAAACTPSHRSTLTGLHLQDIAAKNRQIITGEWPLIPNALEAAGYTTFGIGKWWMDNLQKVFTHNTDDNHRLSFAWQPTQQNPPRGMQYIFNFIDSSVTANTPFFAFVAPNIPHYPFRAPAEYRALYKTVDMSGEPINQNSFGELNTRKYFASITWLDTRLGELLAFLDARGLRENTLIICLTDNGAGIFQSKAHFTEAGTRTPIIVNFPGVIPPTGGHPALVNCIDVFPTLVDYAGGTALPWPDATSFRALAEGTSAVSRKVMFGSWQEDRTICDSQYRLYVRGSGTPVAVYDVLSNPYEDIDGNLLRTPTGEMVVARLAPPLDAWARQDYVLLAQLLEAL